MHTFPVILDSSASCSISHDCPTFPMAYKQSSPHCQVHGGIAHGLLILGTGELKWVIHLYQIHSYLWNMALSKSLPLAGHCLLSPQWFLQHNSYSGSFIVDGAHATLNLDSPYTLLHIHLFSIDAVTTNQILAPPNNPNPPPHTHTKNAFAGIIVLDIFPCNPFNVMFVKAKLGVPLFFTHVDPSNLKQHPKCKSCLFGKMEPLPLQLPLEIQSPPNKEPWNATYTTCVDDHFQRSTKGCLYTSHVKTANSLMFSRECIFSNHASGFIPIVHQVHINTSKSLNTKLHLECLCYNMGVKVTI